MAKVNRMGVPPGEDVFDEPEQVDMQIPPTRGSHISETVLEESDKIKVTKFNDGTVRTDHK